MNTKYQSKYSYFGTDIFMCLGDRVRIKRFFLKDLVGDIVYIPGVSSRNKSVSDISFILRLTGSDSTYDITLIPENRGYPYILRRKIMFISRGDPTKDMLDPNDTGWPEGTPVEYDDQKGT